MTLSAPARFEDTLADLAAYFQAMSARATDFNVGSVLRTVYEAFAQAQERSDVAAWAALNRAIDEAVFNAWGFPRRGAQPATGALTLFRAAGTVAPVVIQPGQRFRVPGSTTQVYQVSQPPAVGSVLASGTLANAYGSAVAADGTRAYATASNGFLAVLDLATNTLGTPIAAPSPVFAICTHPTLQRAYVTRDNGTVGVWNIDPTAGGAYNTLLASTSVGSGPIGVAIRRDATKLYVANFTTGSVTVCTLNTTTGAITGTSTVSSLAGASAVAINPLNNRVYVTTTAGLVVLDPNTNAVITTIAGLGNVVFGVTVNPAGTRVYVSGGTAGNVAIVDAGTHNVLQVVPVGSNMGGVYANPVGTWVYATSAVTSGTVSVLDATTGQVAGTIAVGNAPYSLAQPGDGRRLVVTNFGGGTVSLIDTTSTVWTVPQGAASANVNVQCVTPGTVGNVGARLITEAVPPLPNIVQIQNVSAFTNGLDPATDADRRSDFRAYMQALPRGTVSALTYGVRTAILTDPAGLELERVRKANVFEGTSPGTALTVLVNGSPTSVTFNLGTVALFVHNGASNTSQNLINFAQQVVNGYTDSAGAVHDGWRPAGVACVVYQATEQSQAVTINGTTLFAGYRATQVIPLIQNAIVGVFASLDVGQTLYLSALQQAIRNVPGVADFAITTPNANLVPGANALVVPGAITVS